ncbi:MAG TPA: CDP-6-deoxy-delta-3,4-glucoseen reductase [Burkholderiaceae bacterium]|nr:CDP-6-deoxy-delta-3,4-glucoseen reductase [Burkholderiaceae bacterium]
MAFKVSVRPSGRQFTAEATDNILDAALRSGVGLPFGCKDGACGSCKAKVLSGELEQGWHAAPALSHEEHTAGMALLCCAQARSDLEIEVREIPGYGEFPARKMPCRITHLERAATDVVIVTLQLPASERLQYQAGQFLEFALGNGARRSYSIATAPHADEPISIHVRHMPGGVFTDALFGAAAKPIKERDILRLEGPLGTFFLRTDSERPIVLLASGTGFAPIKAIAETIFHLRLNHDDPTQSRRTRTVVLYWGARARRDLYMNELPERWGAEQPNFRYVPVLSDALAEDAWTGRTGFVHQAVMQDLPDLSQYDVYACGAPAMVEAARRDFTHLCGLPEDQFMADAFTSKADVIKD